MSSETKEQFFYIRNKRCKVVANDQCITIQSDLTPNCKYGFCLLPHLLKVFWMIIRWNCCVSVRQTRLNVRPCRRPWLFGYSFSWALRLLIKKVTNY